MVQAPQVTRWVGGHRELADSQPLSHFWEDGQDLSCRMLDLKWTGCVRSCVCGFLLLSHVCGLFLPWGPRFLPSGVCLGTQLTLTPVSVCTSIWPHSWIVLWGLTLQLGVCPSQWHKFPAKFQVAEPFGPRLPGALVPSGILQVPDGRPQPRGSRLLAHPFSCDGLDGESGDQIYPHSPLLSVGYPVAQRAYLEVDLDCWPWPFIPRGRTMSRFLCPRKG